MADDVKRRGRGAPTKLTPELTQQIAKAVEVCNSLETGAAHCGVHRTTVFMWAQKGREQASGPYRDFFDAIELAKEKRRMNIQAQMVVHAKKNWQALAWLAERTDPKMFGLRIKVQVNEELERIYDKLQRHLAPEDYERALEAIAQPDDSDEASGAAAAVDAAVRASVASEE